MYVPAISVAFLNGSFWSIYAAAVKNTAILVPNAIGAALASLQLVLCVIFRK